MNLTQAVRKANLKRWKAQGPAVIESPLKVIRAAYPSQLTADGRRTLQPAFAKALHAANRGDGITVTAIARAVL